MGPFLRNINLILPFHTSIKDVWRYVFHERCVFRKDEKVRVQRLSSISLGLAIKSDSGSEMQRNSYLYKTIKHHYKHKI